jgi:hypothetical protein
MSLPQDELDELKWRKAKRSKANGNCAEVASAAGAIIIRDSRNPQGPALYYSPDSWRSFIRETRETRMGCFDTFR